jgi:hypothetical protein
MRKDWKPKVEAGGTYKSNVLVEVEEKGVPRAKWPSYNFNLAKYFDVIKPYLEPLEEAEEGVA